MATVVSSTRRDDDECKTTYLMLGDGDFSYSVDLAKYLGASRKNDQIRVVATCIDSFDETIDKYRDSPALLQELKAQGQTDSGPSVEIRHGVNAVIRPSTRATTNDDSQVGPIQFRVSADHVVFNHPHLGLEDAALHKRFLAHFLYSATCHWMKPNGGILHLTLVKGQYERWSCSASAERHGLVLLQRNPFRPPPLKEIRRYQYRRHQTGRSFVSRTPGGSETFTYGRKRDEGKHVARHLPWQHEPPTPDDISGASFACSHCQRVFREARSLNNHVASVHGLDERKCKRTKHLECALCREQGIDRSFPHEQSLTDHMRAKHTGCHSMILPDWAAKNHKKNIEAETGVECSICGSVSATVPCHLTAFVPSSRSSDLPSSFICIYCAKEFGDVRSQRQHENFCSLRPLEEDFKTSC